jgi:hypothetical protein
MPTIPKTVSALSMEQKKDKQQLSPADDLATAMRNLDHFRAACQPLL